jgi:hypothetical protein
MAQPSTPASSNLGVFGSAIYSGAAGHAGLGLTPGSAASSTNTFLMSNSPVKPTAKDNYRPKVVRTLGQRPACLVNATVTYCGGNNIYAFGGFDAYTDEVYNHVLKLDMVSHQWSLGTCSPPYSGRHFLYPPGCLKDMENNVICDTDIQPQLTTMATFLELEWVCTASINCI